MEIFMKAVMEWIFSNWQKYWGGGAYQYLLLLSAAYLLIFHRKKQSTRQVLSFSSALLFVFVCPLTAKVIRACIGQSVYWRVLWILPAIPAIALAATEFLRSRRSKLSQAVLLILCCGVIALSGRDMLSAGNYTRTANRQKVPDEVVNVCNMVLAEAEKDGLTEVFMASDDHVSTYARVYAPSIRQPYGRWGMGAMTLVNERIYLLMQRAEPRDYNRIARLCRTTGCNFVVISVPDSEVSQLEAYGYFEIGDVGAYSVFQLEEDASA